MKTSKSGNITTTYAYDESGRLAIERGPGNWEWVQAILRVIDRRVVIGGAIASSVSLGAAVLAWRRRRV